MFAKSFEKTSALPAEVSRSGTFPSVCVCFSARRAEKQTQ
jgi:hypothetical protein